MTRRLHADCIQPCLLYISDTTAAKTGGQTILSAVDTNILVYCGQYHMALEFCVIISICHIPQKTGFGIFCILTGIQQNDIGVITAGKQTANAIYIAGMV